MYSILKTCFYHTFSSFQDFKANSMIFQTIHSYRSHIEHFLRGFSLFYKVFDKSHILKKLIHIRYGLETILWTRTNDEFINFVDSQSSHNSFYGNTQKRISKTYFTTTRSYKFLAEEDRSSWKLVGPTIILSMGCVLITQE